jgi:hypothetical protein
MARAVEAERPSGVMGDVNWREVDLNKWIDPELRLPGGETDRLAQDRAEFTRLYDAEDLGGALLRWKIRKWEPLNTLELSRLAQAFAEEGDESAAALAERLRRTRPAEADAITARLRFKQQRYEEATAHLERALVGFRTDPWTSVDVMARALDTAVTLARTNPDLGARAHAAMSRPFAAGQWEHTRRMFLIDSAFALEGCGGRTIRALLQMEPNTPWTEEHLRRRRQCYAEGGLSLFAATAEREWRRFRENEPPSLADGPAILTRR